MHKYAHHQPGEEIMLKILAPVIPNHVEDGQVTAPVFYRLQRQRPSYRSNGRRIVLEVVLKMPS